MFEKQVYGENYKYFCKSIEQGTSYSSSIIIENTETFQEEASGIMREFANYYIQAI